MGGGGVGSELVFRFVRVTFLAFGLVLDWWFGDLKVWVL